MAGLQTINIDPLTPLLDVAQSVYPFSVVYGPVPQHLENAVMTTPWYEISEDEFLLTVPNVGRFYVRQGEEIVAEKQPQVSEQEALLFLLDSPLAVLMFQKGLMVFRGAAIEKEGKAWLIAGAPGTGKSVLVKELLDHPQIKLLSDGHIFLSGQYLLPGFQQLTLWLDMVEHYGLDPTKIIQPRPGINKFWVPAQKVSSKPKVKVAGIYVLRDARSQEFEILPIQGKTKLKDLWDMSSWKKLAEIMNIKKKYFFSYVDLAKQVPMKEVFFNHGMRAGIHPDKLSGMIIKDLEQWSKT